jgi:hypothetical protein
MGKWRGVYRVLVRKPEGERPLGKSMRRWENNIKMDLQEVEWVNLAPNRDRWRALVNSVTSLRVP